jgi:hypothetical protein
MRVLVYGCHACIRACVHGGFFCINRADRLKVTTANWLGGTLSSQKEPFFVSDAIRYKLELDSKQASIIFSSKSRSSKLC